MNKRQILVTALILVVSTLFVVSFGVAQNTILNPIKPGSKQAITDEQQAILAVRGIKPAVVDIVGSSPGVIVNLDGTSGSGLENGVEGTGVIIDPSGYIVTNNHVAQNAKLDYNVVLTDGTTYKAKVVGLDKFNDVALLKIDAANLPAAKFGDSDSLETGQSVFAIGNSLGRYQNTVTRGVVSGLGRTLGSSDYEANIPRLQKLIQTDAAINPGNSGGPLINLAGEVIGINTLIDQQGAGLGFAIPSNVVKQVVSQIRMFGKSSHPFLGVAFMTISPTFDHGRLRGVTQGAYITAVSQGGPAETAGLKFGDIITAVNHEALTESNELDKVISNYEAGTQVLITYDRDGKKYDATVVLGDFK